MGGVPDTEDGGHEGRDQGVTQEPDMPGTAVCTAHQRFIPCRKKGKCVISEDPADIAEVTRIQLADFRRQREITRQAETWPLIVDTDYGDLELMCGGYVMRGTAGTAYPSPCRSVISSQDLRTIRENLHHHLSVTAHTER